MNLAFCIFNYRPFGGLQRDFLRIAKCALARGHKVTVFTCAWQGEKPAGFEIHQFKTKAMSNHGRAIEFAKLVQASLKQFDCVIGFNRMPGLDLYFAGDLCFKALLQSNKAPWVQWLPRYRTFLQLEKAVYGPGSKTLTLLLDPLEKQRIQKYYHTPDERLKMLEPGIDANRIPKDPDQHIRKTLRAEYHIADQDFLIVMIGSDFYRKGVDRAIQAVASLPEILRSKCRLNIIGAGDVKPFERLAIKLGVKNQVSLIGPREDAPNFLLAADVLLHLAREETAGMVLIEALVAKLPVIVTSNCGYAPIIAKAKAGIVLSSPFDAKQCAVVLSELLQKELKLYQQSAAVFLEQHDLFGMTDAVVNQIELKGK